MCCIVLNNMLMRLMEYLLCFQILVTKKEFAETIKLSGLNVPVLIQAYPDDLSKMDVVNRRDAWCGKISVCNNLYQFGIKYSLTTKHVTTPTDKTFITDLQNFLAVCRVVKGMSKVRIGAVGARPAGFNTFVTVKKFCNATASLL
jgi:L-fucose isomerase-like protein